MTRWAIPALLLTLGACGGRVKPQFTTADLQREKWDEIVTSARGTTVNFGMWTGEEARNRFFQTTVIPLLRQRYGITLRIIPTGDTAAIVNKVLNEKTAGRLSGGSIDMVWINGENFRSARQGRLLWGPFAGSLPNIGFYDPDAGKRDFGTAIEGYEAPWERAQFVFAHDIARVPQPPRTIEGLRAWIKAHPGRFSYVALPDFTGSAFIRHILIHFGGGAANFQNGFHEALYRSASSQTIDYLNEIKPYLWRQGETYPATLNELDRLFANSEIDFAMSYGPNFAATRVERGEFPPTTRTFVLDEGTIGNYSFLAIPFNANNVTGALVAINHMMSFEHLYDACQKLGQPFPLAMDRLTSGQRTMVNSLPVHKAALSIAELQAHYMPEPDAEYLIRLEKDWRAKVLRR